MILDWQAVSALIAATSLIIGTSTAYLRLVVRQEVGDLKTDLPNQYTPTPVLNLHLDAIKRRVKRLETDLGVDH